MNRTRLTTNLTLFIGITMLVNIFSLFVYYSPISVGIILLQAFWLFFYWVDWDTSEKIKERRN